MYLVSRNATLFMWQKMGICRSLQYSGSLEDMCRENPGVCACSKVTFLIKSVYWHRPGKHAIPTNKIHIYLVLLLP